MSSNENIYICSICKSSADLFCDCSKIFLCAGCVGSHLLKSFAVKHRPILISEYLISSSQTDRLRPDLKLAIQSKLSNELLELEEFRKICLQKISEVLQSAEKQLLEIFEKIMNEVSDGVDSVNGEIKTALGTLKLSEKYPNKILSFFDGCKSIDEIRDLSIVHKSLELKYLNIESVVKECICFQLQTFSAPGKKELDTEYRARSNSGHARTCTLLSDRDSLYSEDLKTIKKFQSIKIPTPTIQRSVTPSKLSNPNRINEIELTINNPTTIESDQLKKVEKKKTLLFPVLVYFYPNTNKFALYNVNDSVLNIIDVSTHFFLNNSAWSTCEGGRIVQTGGYDTAPRNETFVYNLITGLIEKAGHLNIKRYNHSQISLADFVYVVGGINKSALKSVERLNLIDFKWKKIGNLNIARSNPACCSHNNKLYIIGGEETKSVEQFNTISKKFTLLSLLLPSIGKWGVFSYDDRIILLRSSAIYEWDGISSNIKKSGEIENREWVLQGESYNMKNEIYFISQQILYRYDLGKRNILIIKDLSN